MLAEYRQQFAHFNEAVMRAYFLHYSGQKEALELEPVYDRYADLFTLDAIGQLRRLLQDTPDHFETTRRGITLLIGFAEDGFIERSVRPLTEDIAASESRATIRYNGHEVSFYRATDQIAHETDPATRRSINHRRIEVIDRSNPQRIERIGQMHRCSSTLGYENYARMISARQGLDLSALAADSSRFLEATEEVYRAGLEKTLAATTGIGVADADRADLYYFLQRREYAELFPEDGVIAAYRETLSGLGIEMDKQRNVIIDDARRPGKHPRAFCAPIRIPHEIALSITLIGGPTDYETMLHEGGHAQHFAWTSPTLAEEFKYAGDDAVTEGFAFLFHYLVLDSKWLQDVMRFSDSDDFIELSTLHKLLTIRRYAAKLNYEAVLHSTADFDQASQLYAELLTPATKFRHWPEEFLYDTDDGFYSANYLRAWLLETQLREYLKTRFGRRWWKRKGAAQYLIDLWNTGERYTAEELAKLADLGILSMENLVGEFNQLLRG
jgi:hypothetical protein